VKRQSDSHAAPIETALVPGGEFMMGADDGRPDERPAHRVRVRDLHHAITPVTNRQYRAFLTSTGREPPRFWSDTRFNASDQPAVGTTWFDAEAFCRWLSRESGDEWRLPTEAEREHAAIGEGTDCDPTRWPDAGRFAQDAPSAVGLSRPNTYGLLDMTYNVHEWCSDWYDARYYERSPQDDPPGPASGVRRASRGGAWRHQIKVSRCTARSSLDPSFQYNDYGFRVVREPTWRGGMRPQT
jgi:formylglycine-generating enzyme required for sulfatase activity